MSTIIKKLTDMPAVAQFLHRIGAEARSLRTAVVRINHGQYWKDIATIKFDREGITSVSNSDFGPTGVEVAAIKEACQAFDWPTHVTVKRVTDAPPQIANAEPKDVFEFKDSDGNIIMLQLRNHTGKSKYVPYTFWSDGVWRAMEPDGLLPLYNMDKLSDQTTIFLHEGAKSARHVQWMIEGETLDARQALEACPWGEELKSALHLGWIGGALSPKRTDWSVLNRAGVRYVYIVADNDDEGTSAVPHIAREIRCPTFAIQFTSEWPGSFDLADKWPAKMFKKIGDKRFYNGPSFRACTQPATYATDVHINPETKKQTITMRDSFRDIWVYVEEADLYVCKAMPEILRVDSVLNNMLAPFYDSKDITSLIVKAYTGRHTRLCYRPDVTGRVITNKGAASINLHVPTQVKSVAGDATPFLDFMAYLIPDERECKEVLRWCATLIAQPGVHMEYGLLLVSEKQGIGKTTLGSAILSPLVGEHNVSYPTERDITNSDFNDWLAHKRLAVVNEIYSGHSWKAYNALKGYITDQEVNVNQKFQRKYTIENWCHMFACSNSLRALRMEEDDRRWLYPKVNEKKWPKDKFVALRGWLASGGLSIILNWAQNFPSYVTPGERAPMTERKKELIEGSRSEAQREVIDLGLALKNKPEPAALAMKDIEQWAKNAVQGKMFDSDYELRKAMKEGGDLTVYDKRIVVGGRLQYVLMNDPLTEMVSKAEAPERIPIINKAMVRASDILQVSM